MDSIAHSDESRFDVAIIGYGPVGQALACLLGQQGHRVLVVERHERLWSGPRAGGFDAEVMRIFQSIGIADALEPLIRPLLGYELMSAEGEVLKRVRMGIGGSGWKHPFYLMFQPQLEQLLDAAARSYPGVIVHMGHEAIELDERDDAVYVTVRARPGDEGGSGDGRRSATAKTFAARYVVGADGANSFVRTSLGIPRADLGFPAFDFFVLDFEQYNPDRSWPRMGELRQILDPARPTTVGRWNGNQWSRWEFMRMPGESREEMESEDRAWELLHDWGVTPDDGRIVRHKMYTFESKLAQGWRRSRVLLAGDAAHTMPPFMGQGMCSGLRDAMNLAWRLDLVLGGKASADVLDTYEEERSPHVRRIIELSIEVGEMVTVSDPVEAERRNARLRTGEYDETEHVPGLESGVVDLGSDGRPLFPAGELGPQGRVYRAGRLARLDDFIGRGWRIITRHPINELSLTPEHKALIDRLEIRVAHVTRGAPSDEAFVDVEAEYAVWFADHGKELIIQRPDFYLFGGADTVEGLPDLLDRLRLRLGFGAFDHRPTAMTSKGA